MTSRSATYARPAAFDRFDGGSDRRAALVLLLCVALLAPILSPAIATAQGPGSGALPPTDTRKDVRSRLGQPSMITPLDETGEIVADVQFEGARTIILEELYSRVKTQKSRPLSPRQIREDVRNLYQTRWFFSVEPRVEDTAAGPVVVFRVLERPIVQRVEFRGNEVYTAQYLTELIGLKPGSPFDVALNREAAQRIEREYKDKKGRYFVKVDLLKGGKPEDREVVFQITEGPKVVVAGITINGSKDISAAVLKTKLQTKTQKFWFFGGNYDPSTMEDDEAALRSYYQALGYFDIQIKKQHAFSDDKSKVYIDYTISEGPRYRIRDIKIEGTDVIPEGRIRPDLQTRSGDFFTARTLTKDIDGIQSKYGEMGRINAQVTAIPQFLPDQPGVMDLKLAIDEDEVWRIRRINVHITGANGQPMPHTRESVILNNLVTFPGELANPQLIKQSERRINRQSLFEGGPKAPRIEFNPVPEEETRLAQAIQYGDRTVRGQNTERTAGYSLAEDDADDVVTQIRGQSFDQFGQPVPGTPLWDNNPGGDPFGPLRYGTPPPMIEYREGDLDIYVEESRTGRLMFGVGVNSDSGVVGNIVLDERNFDIFRPPTSFDDIIEGRAWRGGGQTFRLEAVPGSIVSRYTASWTDPYFLNTDYSLNLSGFFYERFLDDWDEKRVGGRVGVGRQITPALSVNATLRLEEVQIRNPRGAPPPVDLTSVVGDNFFSSARFSVSHDTRDSAFLPGEGHNVVGSFEQAFGDFVYPRAELDASQYYTLWSRIDGQGRHILSVNGNVGWSENDTPIFERFYAGGFSSFRGFEFRGVTPVSGTVETGGFFQFLGSVQYQFPVTADESIQLVAFTDFGTVDREVSLDAFRVSVGGGLRIMIPAMGPVPLAFDWAVPVVKEPFDQTQLFSFYIGINR